MTNSPLRILLVNIGTSTALRLRGLLTDTAFGSPSSTIDDGDPISWMTCIDQYDVVLLGARAGAAPATDMVRSMRSQGSECPTVVIDTDYDYDRDREAIAAGADDYLGLEDLSSRILLRAIDHSRERRRSLAALEQSRAQLHTVIRNAPVILFAADADGRVTLAEGKALAGLGPLGKQLVGSSMAELFPADPEIIDAAERALTGEVFTRRLEANGNVYECHYAPVLNARGEVNGVSGVAVDITARSAAVDALRLRDDRFRLFIENALDIITLVDVDGTIRFGSPSIEPILGYTPSEIVGRNIVEFLHPDDHDEALRTFSNASSLPHLPGRLTIRLLHADGTWRSIESIASNLVHDPSINGYIINSRDVTDRLWIERESEQLRELVEFERERLEDLIAGVSGVMWEKRGGSSPGSRVFTILSQGVEKMTGYSVEEINRRGWISLIHPDDAAEFAQTLEQQKMPGEYQRSYRILRRDGRIIWLDSHLVTTADDTGQITERGIWLDVTARKATEEALRQSEERFQVALKSSSMVVFTQDLDLRYTWLANTGYGDTSAFIGKQHRDRLGEKEAAMLDSIKQSVIDTGIGRHEEVEGIVDGERRFFDLVVEPLRDHAGTITGVIGSAFDLTRYYQARKSLERHQALFQAFIDHSPALTYIKDAEGHYLVANQKYADLLGITSTEIIGKTDADLFSPPRAREFRRQDLEVIEHGRVRESVERNLLGESYWHSTKFLIRDDTGAVMLGGSAFEITDRMRAEQLLGHERARMADLISSIPGVVWEASGVPDRPEQRIDFVSDYVESLIGYTPEQWTRTPNFWLTIVHPDDREHAAKAALRRFNEGGTGSTEFRWITRDGRVIWVESHAVVVRDSEGAIIGLRGVTLDITERKTAEQSLRQSEERFRVALRNSSIAVFTQDLDLRYTWSTNSVLKSGVSTIGKQHSDLVSEEEAVMLTAIKQSVIDTGKSRSEEIHLQIDGERRTYNLFVEPLLDTTGAIIGVIGSAYDLTSFHAAQKALNRQQALFQAFIDNSPAVTYIKDSDGRYLSANQVFASMLACRPEDIVGKRDIDLFPAEMAEHYSRNDNDVLVGHQVIETEETNDTNGIRTYWHSTKFPIVDDSGAVMLGGSTFEITDRVRAERLLEEQRVSMAELISSIPGMVWEKWITVDGKNRTRYDFVSDYVETLVGYTAGEFLQMPDFWLTIMHPDDQERITALARQEFPDALGRSEFRWITRDGRTIWVEVHLVTVRDESGNVVGARGVTMDITDRKLAEEDLQESQQQLEALLEELCDANDTLERRVAERTAELRRIMEKLEAASQTQKRFIADASHDLRTPLTVLRAELDLLLRQPAEPQMHAALERLHREAKRLDSLTGDLLVLATLEARDSSAGYRRERLDEMMLDCASQLGVVATSRGITWRVECEETIEIDCDDVAVRRMLGNLMENAVKYSDAGATVTLELRRAEPGVENPTVGERVEVVISDTGTGIAEADLPHVFDRFYRGDRTRNTPGTGLGLAIVKAVADAHGAGLRIASVPGEGTTVIVDFPIAPDVK